MIKRNYDVQHVATADGVGSKHGKSSSNLFDKLTKRYSGVIGTRFLRKTPGRKGGVAEPLSDSYDMCGTRSDDFRPEIGAPVLISKTMKFDFDTDSSVEQLPLPRVPSARVVGRPAGTPSTSEDSENDVFLDANSSLPNFGEIKFTFLPESNNNCRSFQNENVIGGSGMGVEAGGRRQLEKSRSKSAFNLHHHHHHHHAHSPEVRLSLYSKAPSLNLSGNSDGSVYLGHQTPKAAHGNGGIPQCTVSVPNSPAVESIYDFPRSTRSDGIRKPPGESSYDLTRSHHVLNEINLSLVSDGDNLYQNLPSPATTTMHYDVPPPLLGGDRDSHQQQSFGSGSGDSSSSRSTREEEFDLKSASLQSLADAGTGAGQLAVSMEELNELTRQINESAAFRGSGVIAQLPDSDEYCEHRKQLHPSERRLTLLKNRSAPGKHFIDFDRRKAKITKKWSGFKSWIGEEQGRIREVVQKHAAMQRVGEAGTTANNNTGGSAVQRNNSDLTTSATSDADSRTENEASASGLPTPPESTVVRRDRTLSSEDREGSRTMQRKSANAEILEGQNGFEEVRRFVKQGGDFGKDLVAILHERTEIEQLYAKSLSKIANKLNKACRDLPGTIAESWRSVSAELEGRSEVHRQFSNSLAEEVVKPLKAVIENQHKARKTIETNVDKSARILAEWRTAEVKAKKNSHGAARENEKLQDAMLDVKLQRTPSIGLLHKTNEKDTKVSEKDSSKLEGKRKKAEEAVKKADVEYYTLCIRAERARVDWEMSVLRGSSMLQTLEGQRLAQFKTHVSDYLKLSAEMSPLLTKTIDRLSPQVAMCSVAKDLDVLKNIRRATEGPSEQLLPDFYCEHTTLAMNRERRKQSLVKLLQLIRQDLDRERRSRNGLKGFSQTLDKNGESNQNIADKLYHIRSMLTYLEGARYKLQSALLELDHKPRSSHPLAQHIQITRDRTGLQTSVLKVPLWLKHDHEDEGNLETSGGANGRDYSAHSNGTTASDESGEQNCLDIKNDTLIKHIVHKYARNGCNGEEGHYTVNKAGKSALHDENSPVWDRGVADGVSNQPDSDFDEFSSQDEDDDPKQAQENVSGAKADGTDTGCSGAAPSQQPIVLGHCRALFNYTPKLYDELELQPGDILEVHIKQEDGWWLGALRGQIGIFPATYVEEIP